MAHFHPTADAPFPQPHHDHASCRHQALQRAEDLCARQGARLTQIRREVLDLLWSDHRPVSAYDLLHRLNADGRKAAPPVVYRALDFLIEHGLAHRLNSLNAFIGCAHIGGEHGAQFFICRDCGQVAETRVAAIDAAIQAAGAALGFRVQAPVVEVEGVCPACAADHGPESDQESGHE